MHPNITTLKWFGFFSEFKLYGPFVVLYFAQVTGSLTAAMAVFATTTIVAVVCEIPTGVISDR